MATIAELNVALTATTGAFEDSLKSSARSLGEWEAGFSGARALGADLGAMESAAARAGSVLSSLKTPAGVTSLALGATAGSVAFLAHATLEAIETSSAYLIALQDQARALSTNVAALAAYRRAARESSTSEEAATRVLDVLNLRIGQAVAGDERLAASFERVGVSAQAMLGQDVIANFGQVADAINALPTAAERAAAAQELFGKSYAQAQRLIQGGSSAIDAAREALAGYASTAALVASELKRLGDEHQRTMENLQSQTAGTTGSAAIQWTAFIDNLKERWARFKSQLAGEVGVGIGGGVGGPLGIVGQQGEEASARNLAAERAREAEAQAAAAAEASRMETRRKGLEELTKLAQQFDQQAASALVGSEQQKLGALAEQIGGGNPAELEAAVHALERLESIKRQQEQQKNFDSTREEIEQRIAAAGLSRAEADKLKLAQMELTSQQREQLGLLYDQLDARQQALDAAKQLADEHKRLEESMAGQLLTLQAEIAAGGRGSNQVQIEKLRLQGASEEQLARLQELADQIEAMESRAKREKDGERGGRRGRELAGLPPIVEAPAASSEAFVRLLANTRLQGERPTPGEELIVAELKTMNRFLGAPEPEPIVAEF